MDDRARVAELLGRDPRGAFEVVVRDDDGDPIVIRNAPLLDDGTPMPTRYYLVGERLVRQVSRLEARGGVREAEAAIDAGEIAATHERYAAERDAAIDPAHRGPVPSGGVGGTRVGVKCLHAHVAHALAGGDDPVGRWALERLDDAVDGTGGHADPAADGVLHVHIDDREIAVSSSGTDAHPHRLPVGPLVLTDGPLRGSDPPAPADLTNALGLVHDHLDDLLIADPDLARATEVVVSGEHATAMARVELGDDVVPAGYELHRAAADEVFRTLALEPRADRRHNPGLDARHVESIVGTCCVILGLMRRFDLAHVGIPASTDAAPAPRADHAGVTR